MKHLSSLLFCLLPSALIAEDETAFDRLLIPNPATLAEECKNDIIRLRIANWQRRGDKSDPFASVEEIFDADDAKDTSLLEGKGCGSRYIWNFLACTRLDDPDADHIVPRGATASDNFEFSLIMEECTLNLEELGIHPLE